MSEDPLLLQSKNCSVTGYWAGKHRADVLLNGQARALGVFELVAG